jgi:hypothetical protein
VVEIRDMIVKIDSSKVYELLKSQVGVRDFQKDGRTLSVDTLEVKFVDCDFICEDNIPEELFENLE